MNSLEQWIALCLTYPIEKCSVDKMALEEDATSAFNFRSLVKQAPSDLREGVATDLLHQLHVHLRGTVLENGVWDNILSQLDHSLSNEIAHDLIDRHISLVALAHTKQDEVILRRLAPLVSEACLTLVGQSYSSSERSHTEFEALLNEYAHEDWLLHHLAHQQASTPEKETTYLQRVQGRPEWQIAQDKKATREQRQREAAEKKHALERATIATDGEEIRTLHAKGEFPVWLALVHNPATPIDILTSLSQSRNFSGAPQLRSEGKNALAKRQAENDR